MPTEVRTCLTRTRAAAALVACLLLSFTLGGCGASRVYSQGEKAASLGEWDRAVLAYARAVTMKPGSTRYRMSLNRAKQTASIIHFNKARRYSEAGQLELAIGELQQTTVLDPTNDFARVELEKALLEWQRQRSAAAKTELELAKERASSDLGVPRLDPGSNIPIILKFKETEIAQIYEALSKASGINFLYDSKLELKKKVSVDLTNVTFESAMGTLMLMNKHFFKVVDENTILLAEDTQQKRREIEDEVIKTFYLSNADVKDVQTLLRTLLDARKIVQNTQLNAITIRDTPNIVAIAEKIIESNDKSKAELLIDVELMEISRTVSETLGINLSSQRFNVAYQGGDTVPLNNLSLLQQLGNWAVGPIPSVTLDFLKSDSGTQVIARPQLRVTEGEKANLHIGDSVPIPTTTFNTTGTVGTSVVPITSFTYQEVGIVIEIEPRVHHNNEISLKLNVEVSQLGDQVSTGQGQTAPAINTRQINTVIRLMNGETNLLAGLITETESAGRSGFPGVIDTPILQRIFSSSASTVRKTDLVLTLTPQIIRTPDIRDEDLVPLFIGTKSDPRLRGKASSPFGPDPFAERENAGPGEEGATEEEPPVEPAAPQPPPAQPPPVKGPQAAPPPPAPASPAAGVAPGAGAAAEKGDEDEGMDEEDDESDDAEPLQGVTPGEALEMGTAIGTPGDAEEELEGSGGAVPPQPFEVSLMPSRLTVAGGGGFAFNIRVKGASNVQKMSLMVRYDPAVAEFDRGLEGVLMRGDGSATAFKAEKAGPGLIKVELARLASSRGMTGNGPVASLRFNPVAPGRTMIELVEARGETPGGTSIPVTTAGADVTVSR